MGTSLVARARRDSVSADQSSLTRILYLDTDPQTTDYLVRGLKEENFVVDFFDKEKSAWQAIRLQPRNRTRSLPWDVLLVDPSACNGGGGPFLKQLRSEQIAIPVIYLCDGATPSARVAALDMGADDCLDKPIVFAELLARIRAAIRRQSKAEALFLEYGDVCLNLSTQRAERNGRHISLTQLEYCLLAFFLRHPEEVLSRTRLYAACYDERFDGQTRTMEVHVMNLRRKLERHGPRLVHTVYGRGYLLSMWQNLEQRKSFD
jgi:two-component system, OmpR family, copper resistance phosphate regulon response regulator CusR